MPNSTPTTRATLDQLEAWCNSPCYDPRIAQAIAAGVPELPRLKGEQIAPGITRIRGNLCNVHGKYGPCDAAQSGKKPKGGKGGKGRKPRKPAKAKLTPEQRQQARDAEHAQNRAATLGQMNIAPDGQAALEALRSGQQPDPAAVASAGLEGAGLVERAGDGSLRMSPSGRALMTAAGSGDTGRVGDIISASRDRAGARTQRQQAASTRQQAAAARRAQADARRAELDKKRQSSGGGGGGKNRGRGGSGAATEAQQRARVRFDQAQQDRQERLDRIARHEAERAARQHEAAVPKPRNNVAGAGTNRRAKASGSATKAQTDSERAMFAKMGGGGSGGSGGGGGAAAGAGGGSKLWPKGPNGKRTPQAAAAGGTETNIQKAKNTAKDAKNGKVFAHLLGDDEGAGTYEARSAFAKMTHEGNGKSETVPIKSLIVETSSFEPDRIASFMGQSIRKDDAPSVMRYNGKDYLMDGHHRALSRAALGDKDVPVRVYDVSHVKPAGAGVAIPNRRHKSDGESFRVFKDARGDWRWLAQSSTAYRDRDQEIVSTQALADDCARADADGSYGPLRWWHQPGLDLGDCDFNAMHGRVLIESGTFRTPQIAQKVARAAEGLELSLGFFHPTTEPDADGVFHHIRRFERSLTPRGKASNLYTSFQVKEQTPMDETKKAALKVIGFSDADIGDIEQRAAATEKSAADAGVAFKAAEPVELPDVVINGVTYKAVPPALAAAPEGSPAEEAAESPEEESAEMAAGEDDGAEGGLTLSPEDLTAIGQSVGQAIAQAIAPLMGLLDMEKKMSGHVQAMMQPLQQAQSKKDADQAETREQLKAMQTVLAEFTGDQPAVGYRPSQAADNAVTEASLLTAMVAAKKEIEGDQGDPWADIKRGLGLVPPQRTL